MAETKLNMQLLLRRDSTFTANYVLSAGEPGFEISTNTLKIGDGVKTWEQLPIANKAAIDSLIKVTDDKVVALEGIVSKLGDTYATDAEVEAIRSALAEAKLDKSVYESYIADRKLTDTQINAALGNKLEASVYNTDKATFATKSEVEAVDGKFVNYNTTAVQKGIDDAQDAKIKAIADDYVKSADIADFETKENVQKIADDLSSYKTSNGTALAGKVDKKDGYSLISDTEIARLAGVDNYDDTKVKEDIAKKADAAEMTTELAKKVDKRDGYSLISDDEIARLSSVDNYDDTKVKEDIAKKADAELVNAELDKKVDKIEGYSLISDDEIARLADVDNYDDTEVRGLIGDRYTKDEADGKFALKGADAYNDTEVRGLISENAEAIADNADAIATKVAKSDYDVKVKALEDAIATKQGIIPENTYDVYGSAATAESNAKGYVDSKLEEANLGQYTTEQEVKDIVDGVIKTATSKETLDSLVEIVEYLDEHTGAATEMAGAITTLEGKVATIEGKPAYSILSTEIDAWNNEIGAKALAESKTTTAEVKAQIEAYGYATEADLTLAEGRIASLEAIDHDAYKAYADKAEEDAIAAAASALATAKTEISSEIDTDVKAAIDAEVLRADAAYDAKGAAAEAIADAASKYEVKGTAQGIVDGLKLGETYEPIGAEDRAKAYVDQEIGNFKTEVIDPIADRVKALEDAPAVDTGIMEIEAGNDIVVTPGEDGKVTVAHETFTTGAYTKNPADSDKTGDVYLMTGVTVDNGHVTGASVQSLASALMGMTFVLDGGNSTNS